MAELDLRCRCDKWSKPCTNRMTQEDMRCDICRRNRCDYIGAGDWSAHCTTTELLFHAGTFEVRI